MSDEPADQELEGLEDAESLEDEDADASPAVNKASTEHSHRHVRLHSFGMSLEADLVLHGDLSHACGPPGLL